MNLLVKKVNILKFDLFETYKFIHTETYNVFEYLFIYRILLLKQKGKKIIYTLDMGCGQGNVLEKLSYISDLSVGVDISLNSLRYIKRHLRANNIELVRADLETPPFRRKSFDIITLYSTLHHIPYWQKFIYKVNKLLKPSGWLIVFHEPNDTYYRNKYRRSIVYRLVTFIYHHITLRIMNKEYPTLFKKTLKEQIYRQKLLGNMEKIADIHAKRGFIPDHIILLLNKIGLKPQVQYRLQDFMRAFGRLSFPIKIVSILDFILPIFLRRLSPLLMILATKSDE